MAQKINLIFDTEKKKLKFVRKKGNLIIFKESFPTGKHGQRVTQIVVTGYIWRKSGHRKIEGFGYDSPWFESEKKLLEAIDWEFMQKAIDLNNEDV